VSVCESGRHKDTEAEEPTVKGEEAGNCTKGSDMGRQGRKGKEDRERERGERCECKSTGVVLMSIDMIAQVLRTRVYVCVWMDILCLFLGGVHTSVVCCGSQPRTVHRRAQSQLARASANGC